MVTFRFPTHEKIEGAAMVSSHIVFQLFHDLNELPKVHALGSAGRMLVELCLDRRKETVPIEVASFVTRASFSCTRGRQNMPQRNEKLLARHHPVRVNVELVKARLVPKLLLRLPPRRTLSSCQCRADLATIPSCTASSTPLPCAPLTNLGAQARL